MKYRARVRLVDAFQLTEEHYENQDGWPDWLKDAFTNRKVSLSHKHKAGDPLFLRYPGHNRVIKVGDWIVRNFKGVLANYSPDQFESCFEPETLD